MSMTKYLIALDLDGTLLNDKKKISLKTIFYLRSLSKKGHIIIISSGRNYFRLEAFYKKLNIHRPVISNNGNYITNPYDKNFPIYTNTIPVSDVKTIYDLLNKEYFDGFFFASQKASYFDVQTPFNFLLNDDRIKNHTIDYGFGKENLIFDCIAHLKKNIDFDAFLAKCKELNPNINLRIRDEREYVDFYLQNSSKAEGIKYVAKYYSVQNENIIVFGDSINDIEMFKDFDNSFIMKNAQGYLYKYAKNVTKKDNNHNGITYALKQFFASH